MIGSQPWRRLRARYPDVALALGWFAATRLALEVIGVVSRRLLAPHHVYPERFVASRNLWLDIWAHWDSGWYLAIAERGYPRLPLGAALEAQTVFGFFPLYPVLVGLTGRVAGGPLIAGILISSLCAIVSGILIYRLARLDLDETAAARAVQYLFLFPAAFILSGVFAESLYLMLLLAAFLAARRGRWWWAGTAGLLLAATRPPGVLVLLPLALEYARQIGYRPARIRAGALGLLLVPVGLGLVMALGAWLTGDPLAALHSHKAWGHHLVDPLASLAHGLFQSDPAIRFNAALTVICLALPLAAARRFPASYTVTVLYSLLVRLAAASEPWHFAALPRYALVTFPIPLALAAFTRRPGVAVLVAALLALLQGFLMVFWANGFSIVV